MENMEEKREKICKLGKKDKLNKEKDLENTEENGEMIWKIWMKCEMIWKIWMEEK